MSVNMELQPAAVSLAWHTDRKQESNKPGSFVKSRLKTKRENCKLWFLRGLFCLTSSLQQQDEEITVPRQESPAPNILQNYTLWKNCR